MTADAPRSTRPSIVAAAVLLAVILLFGLAAFVAGLNVSGGGAAVAPSPSAQPTNAPIETPVPTPAPTPIIETFECTQPSEAFALLCDTYTRIQADYVDEVSDEDLVEGAIQGMVEALPDAYSGYIPPEQYGDALDDLSGEFSGIGAEVGIENVDEPEASEECTVITNACVLVIVAPLDGSPAEAAGLRSGDVVTAVDGESTIGSTIQEEVLEVRGEAGTEVTLSVRRGERELEIKITRAVIELVTVESRMLDGGIGYVRLAQFSEDAIGELRAAISSLFDQGATRLVFDLRNNPGGFINSARDVASEFLPEGTLIFTQESGETVVEWTAGPGGLVTDPAMEVMLLVNEGSASASEIVAAAFAEHDRATLVGQPTFGKNTVQVWTDLPNGGGLRLTTDRWFTPGHNSVEGNGVQPDVLVEEAEGATGDEDPILDRAVELMGE
jgi:carboxyl-terminal processing protease